MSAWKPCDVRGLFPSEVNPALFRRIGEAVGRQLSSGNRVLIAGDFRLSTPELKAALSEGLLATGAEVLDAGQIPTPVAYFAHRQWLTDAVMIVTASHNPPEYNGLKLMIGKLPPSEAELAQLRAATLSQDGSTSRGTVQSASPVAEYEAGIHNRWSDRSRSMRIVIDAGNGAWSNIAPRIFAHLGFDAIPLFCTVDGSFPGRPPDCARTRNLEALSQQVLDTEAELGIAWDGDGDRVAFVDGAGEHVPADEMSIMLAAHELGDSCGETVVYDIKLSDALRRVILQHRGNPLMEKSGHAFIKRVMVKTNALLGCEVSGHYFYRELNGGDDGLFTALLVCEMITKAGSFAALRETVPAIFITPDLRLTTRGPIADIIAALRNGLRPVKESDLDGVRLETPLGFILVRTSVTEPILTMRIEGSDADSLRLLIDQCLKAIPDLAGHIRQQIADMEDVYGPVKTQD